MEPGIPVPPIELRQRGSIVSDTIADQVGYLERGEQTKRAITSVLPADWSWSGKVVLDFGCGSGRVLRHFVDESASADLWGSDIDERCIAWNREYLDPPMSFVVNGEAPPLPFDDGQLDLVYAMSVFTHITDQWSEWLVEMHRVLSRDGLLVATFMGAAMSMAVSGEPWREDEVGMDVHLAGQSWDLGGPMVLHSPWWIREHWGRAFSIEMLMPSGFVRHEVGGRVQDQGVVVLRRSDTAPTTAELERIDPTEQREVAALARSNRRLTDEVAALRRRQG